jgi:hypothetical protein
MLSFDRRAVSTVTGLAVLALLAADLSGMGPKLPKEDSTVQLVRPDPAPDADAKGSLRVRSDKQGERFELKLQRVDALLEHDLFIEDPDDSGLFVHVAALQSSGDDDMKLMLATKQGDALPLGATDIDALVGRRVEVRAGEDVVLQGSVPAFGLSKKPVKAKVDLAAPEAAPAPDMKATLKLRSKPDKGQERFDLKAKKVPFADAGPFRVFIEDGVGSAAFVDAGALDPVGDSEGRFRRDSKQGQAMPLGAAGVAELAGRAIEVRDGEDVVFLEGTIPALE